MGNHQMYHSGFSQHRQSGVVLVAGLFFLIVLTLVAVAMVKNVTLQEKIAGNAREKLVSFEAAELALKISRRHLNSNPKVLAFYHATGDNAASGLYPVDANAAAQPWEASDAWTGAASLAISDTQNVPANVRLSQDEITQLKLHDAPRYMIGLVGEQDMDGMDSGITQKFFIFSATAHANSGLPNIKTTLQARVVEAL